MTTYKLGAIFPKVIVLELTEVKFWEEYWANCQLPNVVNHSFSFERCLAHELTKLLAKSRGDVLEIGCAPGKWLAFLARELGLKPSGIEYSEAGMTATVKNFQLLGIDYGNIWSGDFFQLRPEKRFSVVMSLGFIEHFTNADMVIERHLQWLEPGGLLVLGVPNFLGIYQPIQRILDKTILDKHNLEIMHPCYFRGIARQYGLEMLSCGYIGSFEPSLPIAIKGSNTPAQLMLKVILRLTHKLRRLRAFDNFNNPFISSYLLTVFRNGA